MYSSTSSAVMWAVSARCPLCQKPLVLRHNHTYRHVVVCLGYPTCRFVSEYSQLVHALLDRIIELQDQLEDLGHPVERSLP
jgi:ssDNA-binding Zn-finger/Zn-ribbon topoisomerase 1